MGPGSRVPGAFGVVASLLGGFFAAFSTHDYAQHLDRQLHGNHCSFLPGIAAADAGENACSAAMYSPYSALFKDRFWGGLPISLFGLGAFAFFLAVAIYLTASPAAVPRRTRAAYFIATLGPAAASVVMLVISLTKLGAICKLCGGIYFASFLLLASGMMASFVSGPNPASGVSKTVPEGAAPPPTAADPPGGSWVLAIGLLLGLGIAAALPAVVYAGSLPDYRGKILSCGKLSFPDDDDGPLIQITTVNPVQPAVIFEDPLCPTCKAFHDRLVTEGIYDQLDLRVAVFPLDKCNWLIQGKSLHPGACEISKAVLCADKRGNARAVLEWSYENQEELTEAGKRDPALVREKLDARFPELSKCIDEKATQKRLDEIFHLAAQKKVRILTPQLYLGDQRVCDEDTDMGLRYALTQLAPKIK